MFLSPPRMNGSKAPEQTKNVYLKNLRMSLTFIFKWVWAAQGAGRQPPGTPGSRPAQAFTHKEDSGSKQQQKQQEMGPLFFQLIFGFCGITEVFSLALKGEVTVPSVLVGCLKLQFQLFVWCWCDGSSIIKKVSA